MHKNDQKTAEKQQKNEPKLMMQQGNIFLNIK